MNKIIYYYQEGITIDTSIMPDGRVIMIEFNKNHKVIEHSEWHLLSSITYFASERDSGESAQGTYKG